MFQASTRSAGNRRLDHGTAAVNPARRGHRGRRLVFPTAGPLIAGALLVLGGAASAGSLLVGTMPNEDGTEVAFRFEAESREDVVGGRLVLGDTEYEVTRVSRLGLIGARRFVIGDADTEPNYAEFLVFSSSFSAQTAVGEPWVAAREAFGCDGPYNSFLALYRIDGEAAVKALGPIPYPDLAEDLSLSHHSRVSCFIARPSQ